MKPRSYQNSAHEGAKKEYDAGRRAVLIVMPTGTGKTHVAAHIADDFISRGRIMVLAHRDELIRQAANKFLAVTGHMPEIEKGSQWANEEQALHGKAKIIVSSFQSQNSGKGDEKRMHRFDPKEFSLLWVDEAHHALAPSFRAVIDYYMNGNPEMKLLGVTATPDRADGDALGKVFESVAFNYELPDAIHDGYLVPIHQYSVGIEGLDFSRCRTTAGDLNAADLEAIMVAEKPLHGLVHASIERACDLPKHSLNGIMNDEQRSEKLAAMLEGKPRHRTLIFTVGVAHAARACEILNRWIPSCATYVVGEGGELGISQDDRRERLKAFKEGQFQFLVNCMVATEGYDEPGIEIVVMGRPTKSRSLFAQMIGRGTRPLKWLGDILGEMPDNETRRKAIEQSAKPFCEVLDFVGNSGRHRLVTAADLLGGESVDEAIIDRANELAQEESIDVEQAIEIATDELELEAAVNRLLAEREAQILAEEDERKRMTEDMQRRKAVVATAMYQMTEVDGSRFATGMVRETEHTPRIAGAATEKQIGLLTGLGVSREQAKRYGVRQAGAIIEKLKQKRCTLSQERALRNYGRQAAAIAKMNFYQASEAIDAAKRVGAA